MCYVTGFTLEKTFRAGSTYATGTILFKGGQGTKQFTYKDGSQFVFMDLTTFEESRLNEADVSDKQKWLKEGMDCNLLCWNGKINPITVRLTVTDTDPGASDSAQDDDILVDSRTGQYMNRA